MEVLWNIEKIVTIRKKVLRKKATEYAGEDADVTFRLYKLLKDRLDKEKLTKVYEIFEKPMVKVLSSIETNGIKVDQKYLKELSNKQVKFLKLLRMLQAKLLQKM